MSDARASILAGVRAALAVPTERGVHADVERLPPDARAALPPVPADPSEWPAIFTQRMEALRGRCYRVVDEEEAAGVIARMAHEEGWNAVYLQDEPMVAAVSADLRARRVSAGAPAREMADCDAGITTCRALVAQTGSILVTAADGGRAGTVLAPHHVVVARESQLVPDLPDAWQVASAGRPVPSFVSLVTGPSRTADIERTLVLGAHGPIRLTVLILP